MARVATRCEQDTEALPFKRSSSREQDKEINGLIDALGTRHRSAAVRVIENAAESEIGPTIFQALSGSNLQDPEPPSSNQLNLFDL